MGMFSTKISTKQMVPLCRQLSTSYGAGIPIIQTLEHVGTQFKDPKVRRVMRSMSDDLHKGSTLAQAAFAQEKYLPTFFIQLLASGEHGGHLDVMLRDLADFYEDRLKTQREIRGAMVLPIVYVFMAWHFGTFAIGMLGVIDEAMAGTGGGLEGVLEYARLWAIFQAWAWAAFIVLLCIAAFLSRKGLLGWITGLVTTHIWPLSKVTRQFGLARFFRSMALLLGSGLGIIKCVEQSAAITANPYMEKDLLRAVPYISRGSTLVEAFSHTRFLTPLAREMLAVGEQSGNLEGQLKKIAEYHLQAASHAVEMATKIIGYMIMLAIMILIGGIVIYFYANLYGGIMDDLGI